eukprot:483650-Karenia_brevis.AAC.1
MFGSAQVWKCPDLEVKPFGFWKCPLPDMFRGLEVPGFARNPKRLPDMLPERPKEPEWFPES